MGSSHTYTITFISLEDSKDLSFEYSGPKDEFTNIIETVKYYMFYGSNVKDGIAYFMTVSEQLCKNYEHLAKALEPLKLHKLNALPSWLRKVGTGNHFVVAMNRPVSTDEAIAIQARLNELHGGIPAQQYMEQIEQTAGIIWQNYDIYAHSGDRPAHIGEPDKTKRRCRYCGRTQAEGAKFKKKGHTISEGLGNKSIITRDECDECNAYFGQNAEQDFIKYIDPLRVLFSIQGKESKITEVKGSNYEMQSLNNERKTFEIKIFAEPNNSPDSDTYKLRLEHNGEIVVQNIYKALVKFAFGIIPDNLLPDFARTAEWLSGKIDKQKLPLVRIANQNGFKPAPAITVYIRNNDNKSLPFAIGEFHLLNMIFVYIIPTFTDGEERFCDRNEWTEVLSIFKIWESVGWTWRDFSSLERIKPVTKLNFQQRENH